MVCTHNSFVNDFRPHLACLATCSQTMVREDKQRVWKHTCSCAHPKPIHSTLLCIHLQHRCMYDAHMFSSNDLANRLALLLANSLLLYWSNKPLIHWGHYENINFINLTSTKCNRKHTVSRKRELVSHLPSSLACRISDNSHWHSTLNTDSNNDDKLHAIRRTATRQARQAVDDKPFDNITSQALHSHIDKLLDTQIFSHAHWRHYSYYWHFSFTLFPE